MNALSHLMHALRSDGTRHQPITDITAAGLAVVGPGGTIVACNGAAERILGRTAQEICGHPPGDPGWQVIDERGFPVALDAHPAMVTWRTGCPQHNAVLGIVRGDGRRIWLSLHCQPLFAADGEQITAVAASFLDITEQREAEPQATESERLYQELVDMLPQCLYRIDRQGRLTLVNAALAAWLGESPERCVGKTAHDFYPKALADRYRSDDARVLRTGRLLRSEEQHVIPSTGQAVWVEVVKTPVRGVEGEVAGIQGIFWDITDRKQSEFMQETRQTRLLEQQRTLAALTRSEVFSGEDELESIRLLTETAARQLGVERVSLWRFSEDRGAIDCIDLYESSSDRHSSGFRLLVENFPDYFEGLATQEAIAADDAKTHPFTHEFSATYLEPLGIGSMLDVPMYLYGRLAGVLCHEHVGAPITWSAEHRFFAIAIANLVSLAQEQGERRKAEALVRGQKEVLELIAQGATLGATLHSLVKMIERQAPGLLCSVMLLDQEGRHLHVGAAPSLPAEYLQSIDGVAIGPNVGSCGTAAYTGEPAIAVDILADPRWAACSRLAEPYGLRACWSMPIFDANRGTLGTFALYHRDPCAPSDHHLRLMEIASHTASVAIVNDLTKRRIHHLAHYDGLTELPNRALVEDRVSQTLAMSARDREEASLLFIDLDGFKTINDSLGHHVGDHLLKAVAVRLRNCLREIDTIARLGGDEFVVLLPQTDSKGAARVARKLLAAGGQPYELQGHRLSITPSIGISVFPVDGEDPETLIRNADTAMYHAKDRGRNTYQFFQSEMNTAVTDRLKLETGLRRALEHGEFLLHYQPQVDIRTGTLIGIEALLRWDHPDDGLVLPGKFMTVAEETGLIVPIGNWVLEEACRQNRIWQDRGLTRFPIAVNISARQFRQGIEETVERILADTRLEPHFLHLELTESMVMHGPEATLGILSSLRAMGVKLSIDDFGTGYSSLSYLKRFPIDKVKIDRSFVRDILIDPDDLAITKAIISMAHSLRLKVIAEGVETDRQLAILREEGCDEAQGYFFAPPRPAEEAIAGQFASPSLTGGMQ